MCLRITETTKFIVFVVTNLNISFSKSCSYHLPIFIETNVIILLRKFSQKVTQGLVVSWRAVFKH